jgi:hypothetical protein
MVGRGVSFQRAGHLLAAVLLFFFWGLLATGHARAQAEHATADDTKCTTGRMALESKVAAVLPQRDVCRRLRAIRNEPLADTECTNETAAFQATVDGHIASRCQCPENPMADIDRCEKIAATSKTCAESQEASLLDCTNQMKKLEQCPSVNATKRRRVLTELSAAFDRCPRCTDWKGVAESATANVKAATSCERVRVARQARGGLLTCSNVDEKDVTALTNAIVASGRKLGCDDQGLASRLFREIESLNQRIKQFNDCSTEPKCRDLEVQRLNALTSYLELVRVRTPEEQARARDLLRGVGTDPTLVDTVNKYGVGAVQSTASIVEIFGSTDLDPFLKQLEEQSMQDLARELRDNKSSLDAFLKVFLRADSETKQRALSLADSLTYSVQEFQSSLRVHEQRGAWELWVEEPQAKCDLFVNELAKYFPGSTLVRGKTRVEFDARVRERHAACSKERRERKDSKARPSELACGLLVGVRVDERGAELEAHGDLFFLDGNQLLAKVPRRAIELPTFPRDRGERYAAGEFARRALIQVSALTAPGLTPPAPPPVAPSKHCGVTVSYSPKFRPAPIRKGLQIQGSCDKPRLVVGIRDRLENNELVGVVTAVDGSPKATSAKLVLNSGDSSGGLEACAGELFYGEAEPRYVVKAVVDTKKECQGEAKSDPATRWKHAGTDVGDLIASYYAQPMSAAVEPDDKSESSGWFALAFAGAPYLADSRATTWSKIVPSALDGALMLGAGISFGVAVQLRNDAADQPNGTSVHPATIALNTGVVLTAVLLGTRIASGVGYWKTTFWQKADR